ncbi:hypothetical protein M441DRAFT_395147 [Trichoderma asperellum CBS 433.97]|uniref:Uncharacterized protein n=1 Tax=Trichoderma asperellum (strain ATCC 204424 / CBS 433.97 / NBRC 101777) TaxID=1042311 RepID=A0A2T3Z8X9_TRIA4|nr:hypothetical protein M441DRAFT_395147 [Trichoderma asperellum CBS 433.97]PTB41240.1 hypothetical protein M441DRAFT_395147 [Trichoderma asperellum CBS 433.97]
MKTPAPRASRKPNGPPRRPSKKARARLTQCPRRAFSYVLIQSPPERGIFFPFSQVISLTQFLLLCQVFVIVFRKLPEPIVGRAVGIFAERNYLIRKVVGSNATM